MNQSTHDQVEEIRAQLTNSSLNGTLFFFFFLAASRADAKQREQALLKALSHQSIQEIELAEKLSKARMEKEVVKNNRLARERELAEIRDLENKQKQLEEMQAVSGYNQHARKSSQGESGSLET